jgi:ribosomal protein S11
MVNVFYIYIYKINTYIIVTDMEGNIRIYRLHKGRGPYHDSLS